MSPFTDALHLKVHTGTLAERPFELLEAFRDWSTIGASEADPRWITVPAGYRTDFASIPRLVWPLLPPVGRIRGLRARPGRDLCHRDRFPRHRALPARAAAAREPIGRTRRCWRFCAGADSTTTLVA